ncbi:MAG: oxidoreductase, partial [Geodermatophilaceae bacterium]
DAGTVRRHLHELVDHAPGSVEAYLAMARRTAERAIAAGRLRRLDAGELLEVLEPRRDSDAGARGRP